ncbi:hypothetical protein [Ruegeria lacuscaerulensis]|uniref:hypothetical protein n=1 Tax=Ruegeria lacuscaerulensis TaxID=55218 RepID=UPI00147A6C37|nr:hypothetical protein [Ruegeria lacuscaerulensis]
MQAHPGFESLSLRHYPNAESGKQRISGRDEISVVAIVWIKAVILIGFLNFVKANCFPFEAYYGDFALFSHLVGQPKDTLRPQDNF